MLDETTKFPELDQWADGFRRGEIMVISGGRRIGKSRLVEKLQELAMSGAVVIKVSLENPHTFVIVDELARLDQEAHLERIGITEGQHRLRAMAEQAPPYEIVQLPAPRANEPYYQRFSRHYRRK